MTKQVRQLDRVVIRFAGDSGDGMQLTGDRFTSETAQLGNDISTLPNFPAEIRAPAGTLPGVSSFQVHFADFDILTPGASPDVLVAMNPAALKANLADLPGGAQIIVNTDEFTNRNLTPADPDAGALSRNSDPVPDAAPALAVTDTVRLAGAAVPLWLVVGGGAFLVILVAVGLVLTLRDRDNEPAIDGLGIMDPPDHPATVRFG